MGFLLPLAQARVLEACRREAAFGNPADVAVAQGPACRALLEAGHIAWAGHGEPGFECYEYTESGAQALDLHEHFVAGRSACLKGEARWTVPPGLPDSFREAWFAGFDAVQL